MLDVVIAAEAISAPPTYLGLGSCDELSRGRLIAQQMCSNDSMPLKAPPSEVSLLGAHPTPVSKEIRVRGKGHLESLHPRSTEWRHCSGSGRWPSDGELTLTEIRQPLGLAAAVIADVSCTRYCSRRNPMPW